MRGVRRCGALAAALALLLGGCSTGRAQTVPTLVMARVKDAINLDPSHASDGLSFNVSSEVMQNIVNFRPGSFEVVGDIADRWAVSADGRTWTFAIPPGQRFSDGTPLDAAAVKFNLDRWRLTNDPAHGPFAYPYYASVFGGFPGIIRDVRAPSPTRLVVTLAVPRGSFVHDLAEQAFAIGSPRAIRADPRGFEQRPIGSGPYEVAEWERDDHITLVANPYWRGVRPGYPRVIVRDIPDPASSVLELETGGVDMLTDPRPDDARALAARGIALALQPPNNTAYVAMQMEKKPFDDLRVRRAIAYAIDKESLVAHLYGKGAVVANDWLPQGMLGDDPALRAYPHDVARAKALLAEAGLAHGFSTTLSYPTSPRPYLPDPARVAEAIQADLRAVGIAVTLQPSEFAIFLAKVRQGRHDLCLIGWTGDNGDPDNFLYPLLDQDSAHKDGTAQNYSFWRDPEFHALMLAGQRTGDQAKRAAIYRRALAMVHDVVPAIPLVHTPVPLALKPGLRGFVPSPNSTYNFVLIHPPAGS